MLLTPLQTHALHALAKAEGSPDIDAFLGIFPEEIAAPDIEQWYADLWKRAQLLPGAVHGARFIADAIRAKTPASERYASVAKHFPGCPPTLLAAFHYRQAPDPKAPLFPEDNPPADMPWATAAKAGLQWRGFHQMPLDTWPRRLHAIERLSPHGLAHLRHHRNVPNPYLWAGATVQTPGHYTADHQWDPRGMETKLGVAAILKAL